MSQWQTTHGAAPGALGVDYSKVLNRWPQLLGMDPGCWRERVAVLRGMNLDIPKVVNACPAVLQRNPQNLQSKFEALSQMGLDATKVVKKCPTVFQYSEERIRNTLIFLNRLGLDSVRVVNTQPTVLCCNVDIKLRPTVRFVTITMGRQVTDLQRFPACFGLSLKGRLIPRYEFAVLHSKQHLSLSTLFGCTDERFSKILCQPPAAFCEFVAQRAYE